MIENVTEVDLERLRSIAEAAGLDWAAAMAHVNDSEEPLYGLPELIGDVAGSLAHELDEMRIEAVAEVEVEAHLGQIESVVTSLAQPGRPCPGCGTPRKRALDPLDSTHFVEICLNTECTYDK